MRFNNRESYCEPQGITEMLAYELSQSTPPPDICILGGGIHAADALREFDQVATSTNGAYTVKLLQRLKQYAINQRRLPEISNMSTPEGAVALAAIYDVLARSDDGRRLHANRAVWDHIETPGSSAPKRLVRHYRELQTEDSRSFRETSTSDALRKGINFMKLAVYAELLQQLPPEARPNREREPLKISPSRANGRPIYGEGW